MIRPDRLLIMYGATARVTLKTPATFTSSTVLMSSSSRPTSTLSRMTPALFTSTSMRPLASAIDRCRLAARRAVADVDLHRRYRLPRRRARGDDVVGRRLLALVEERDVRALGCEQLDDRTTDAAAAAGDDDDLAA